MSSGASDVRIMKEWSSRCISEAAQVSPLSIHITLSFGKRTGKPISFHAAYSWDDRALQMTNRFISVHSLGFMWFNMIHMTNWVINGLPERFPKLKVMWIESGLTWAYCLMQRLDHSYMMRTSDCPSLKRKPSEYMREMFYSSQPMEIPDDLSVLEATFKMINAETQLVWSSDYPHWDFDLPSTIYDLPFLNETSKRNILGANAARLFNLEPVISPVKLARKAARERAPAGVPAE